MHVEDSTRFTEYANLAYLTKLQRDNTVPMLTYEHNTIHPVHGLCTLKIYRAVGNDSGLKREMTRLILAKHEPNVGLWPGDRFEYWKNETMLESRTE